jgi:thiol-disulfide isomerase/thioredoxin
LNRVFVFLLAIAISCCLVPGGEIIAQTGAAENPALTEQLAAGSRQLTAGNYRDALGSFKKANKLQNNSCYQCLLGMASAAMHLEDYKSALESSSKAITLAKDDQERAGAHNLKGNILIASAHDAKEIASAEDEYRAATQLDSAVAVYHLNCATAMIRQSKDKDEAAKRELQACLDAHPAPQISRVAQSLLADPRRGRENFAPDFKVKALSGEPVTLEQFSGKILVIDFWATWCGPCRESVPELKDLTRKYPAEKLVLMSVSVDKDENAWSDFVAKKHMDWLQYRDSDHVLQDAFRIDSFPTYLVVDGEGIIRQRLNGLDPQESVVHRLRKTLEEMPQLSK